MGFLKAESSETKEVESWLGRFWGKMAVGVKSMDLNSMLIQLTSDAEVAEVLACATDSPSSPFTVLEKWMEVIGTPSTSSVGGQVLRSPSVGLEGRSFPAVG